MLTLFCCNPEAALEAQLIEECTRQWEDRERELDLQRLRELYPELERVEPDVVPAELVLEWDAYESDR